MDKSHERTGGWEIDKKWQKKEHQEVKSWKVQECMKSLWFEHVLWRLKDHLQLQGIKNLNLMQKWMWVVCKSNFWHGRKEIKPYIEISIGHT